MRSRRTLASRVTILVVVSTALVGCAHSRRDLWLQHFGVRPDEPRIAVPGATTDPDTAPTKICDVYTDYVQYAQQLQEAYHARATQNRFWIYAAGIIGLGAAAASGGLAAAAAGATTIALVAISGGFAAGSFAAIDNSELAKVYTSAANKIDAALIAADREQRTDTNTPPATGCRLALATLKDGVFEARTTLELARTNNALGALIRAKDEQKNLTKLIEAVEEASPTRVTVTGRITEIDATTKATFPEVVLTVDNVQLDRVAAADVKVLVGTADGVGVQGITKTAEFTYTVRFKAPDIPGSSGKEFPVTLLVGKSRERVTATDKLKYP
jgi:hypothetical protein